MPEFPDVGKTPHTAAPPACGPPASAREGAAAVIRAAVKLSTGKTGQGWTTGCSAEILFHAAFETLDRLLDLEKKPSPGASMRAHMSG